MTGLRYDTWYWLRRRRDGVLRMGFLTPTVGWRVYDLAGRPTIRGDGQVARLFEVVTPVERPA